MQWRGRSEHIQVVPLHVIIYRSDDAIDIPGRKVGRERVSRPETHYYRDYEIAVSYRGAAWEAHVFRTRRELPSPENRHASEPEKLDTLIKAKLIIDELLAGGAAPQRPKRQPHKT